MLRALLVIAGLLIVSTGRTPFDLIGAHVSPDPVVEMALCAVLFVAALFVTSDE